MSVKNFKALVGKQISDITPQGAIIGFKFTDGTAYSIKKNVLGTLVCQDDTPAPGEYEKSLGNIYDKMLSYGPKLETIGFDWGFHAAVQELVNKLSKADKLKPEKWDAAIAKLDAETKKFKWTKSKAKVKKNTKSFKHAQTQLNQAYRMLRATSRWNEEISMYAMVLGDFADHYALACALAEDDLKKINHHSDMDTASREEIPNRVWNFITSVV